MCGWLSYARVDVIIIISIRMCRMQIRVSLVSGVRCNKHQMHRYCCCRFFVYDLCILISCSACNAPSVWSIVRTPFNAAIVQRIKRFVEVQSVCVCVPLVVRSRQNVFHVRNMEIAPKRAIIRHNSTENERYRWTINKCERNCGWILPRDT